ncbi:MAG: glycosyltransferase family 39 protein [Thermoanaerobaculia bacterium]
MSGQIQSPRVYLWAILLIATLLRLGGLFHDLPFSYFGDELHFMKRAMALGTGDLNPHWFHKPALLMYVLLLAYGLYFAAGYAVGYFSSVEHFAAHFLSDHGPFLLIGRMVVLLSGIALVAVVYFIARRIFRQPSFALAAGLVAAVAPPLVASSQEIKADTPCALLLALSVLVYLRTTEKVGLKSLILASLLAGAATGTKYYGIVLVAAYGIWELLLLVRGTVDVRTMLKRTVTLVGFFLLGFFLTSPFNFLDPTFGRATAEQVLRMLNISGEQVVFAKDAHLQFQPGPQAWVAAAGDFLSKLFGRQGMGIPLTLAVLSGLIVSLFNKETRPYVILLTVPVLIFFLISVVIIPFHVKLRHLVAIFPLLFPFAWSGVDALTRALFKNERLRTVIAAGLLIILASTGFARALTANRERNRADSRTIAYQWILENLPPSELILIEDDGIPLQPDQRSISRLRRRLGQLPQGPFTFHQARRLDLLEKYPSLESRNIDLLGRPWWLPREKTDEEIAQSADDLDMSNPLTSRFPLPLTEYRANGVRYVVTTSLGLRWLGAFEDPEWRFPSFVRFYDSLARLEPIHTVDPKDWDGKGPVIWIHDLDHLDN